MERHNPHILSGLLARQALSANLADRVSKLHVKPHLVIISAGSDEASRIYIKNKKAYGESLGILVSIESIPDSISEEELISRIEKLNNDASVHGIIIQSPIPKHLSFPTVTAHVDREKDVDGLRPGSIFVPATARGIEMLLRFYDISISGKHVVVIGRSQLVGLPTALLLLKCDATITLCHSKTENLESITKTADILIVAIGKPLFITKEYISENQIVIDVGIHRSNGKLVGDVDFDKVKDTVHAITPVPGGVGPMTVHALFENVADVVVARQV